MDPAAARASLAKYTKVDDQAMLDQMYNDLTSVFPALPLVHDADLHNVIDLSDDPAVKTHKPAEFYDNSYLQKLQDFVKTLYPEGLPAS